VEQTAAAAESMRMQTAKLSEAVAAFRVDASHAAAPHRAPKAGNRLPGTTPALKAAGGAKAMAPRPATKPAQPRPAAAFAAATPKLAVKPAVKPAPNPAPPPATAASEGDWETF
jgi:methyl-accepting chemotaxis protein